MPLRAIIFDFDGLMVDTESSIYNAYADIFAQHGVELPMSVMETIIGSTGHRDLLFEHLEEQIGRAVDRDTLRERARALHHDTSSRMPAIEGVTELIDDALNAGLKLGVASSSTLNWVGGHLERLNLAHCFSAVCTRDDVERTKPDPALYRLAVELLGVEPHEAVALEDSPNGITAAKAAELHCVAVPSPLTANMRLDHADMRVASLADLNLDELALRFGGLPSLGLDNQGVR